MVGGEVSYWKRLWRWTTSGSLSKEEIEKALGNKATVDRLRLGLASYKPNKAEDFSKLQSQHPDQTKLLNVVQTMQNYIDVDCFQLWDILKNYLCDISYGTPSNALKNISFVDTRPTFLLPNIWRFYYAERLFLLKLLQYIFQYKDDTSHNYQEQFSKIIKDIGVDNLKTMLISHYEKILRTGPPPRKIQNDFSCETIRQEWTESNLREQLAILQLILLIAEENKFTENEFNTLFQLFKKHNFGRNHGYNDLLEEKHREACMRIMYMELCLFVVINDGKKIDNVTSWIECNKEIVEYELTKLQIGPEHGPMCSRRRN